MPNREKRNGILNTLIQCIPAGWIHIVKWWGYHSWHKCSFCDWL